MDEVNPRTNKENLNSLGLANMHGNVWEWVEDDWHGDYEDAPLTAVPGSKPTGRRPGDTRRRLERRCDRTAGRPRDSLTPDDRDTAVGFRLARSVALGT